jgi:hypothetical protein
MDNQHREITGYRELSQDEINLMNTIKEKASEVELLVDLLRAHPLDESPVEVDGRWVSIGVTHLQQGFMALTRAVARPTTF